MSSEDSLEYILFNTSTDVNNSTDVISPSLKTCDNAAVSCVIILLIMISAALGNGLVIGSSFLDPDIRRGGLLPMVTLATTDMIFAEFSCVIILVTLFCPECAPSGALCTVLGVFELVLVISVMYQHALLAFTRYVAICQALKYKIWFSTRRMIKILITIFFSSLVLAIIPSVIPSMEDPLLMHLFDDSLLICIFQPTLVNIAYTSILYFTFPVALGTYSYFQCLFNLRGTKSNQSSTQRQQKRLAVTMLLCYSIVLITSIPLPLVMFFTRDVHGCYLAKRHTCWLILSNSVCNPIIYAIKSSKFRRMFAKQLGFKARVADFNAESTAP